MLVLGIPPQKILKFETQPPQLKKRFWTLNEVSPVFFFVRIHILRAQENKLSIRFWSDIRVIGSAFVQNFKLMYYILKFNQVRLCFGWFASELSHDQCNCWLLLCHDTGWCSTAVVQNHFNGLVVTKLHPKQQLLQETFSEAQGQSSVSFWLNENFVNFLVNGATQDLCTQHL